MRSLHGKSVLITGASRGLGKALALEAASRGARVAITARGAEALLGLEREIRRRGGSAFAIPLDVSDKRSIHPTAALAAEHCGPVDILINNASTLGALPLRTLSETDCEEFERVLQTNLLGPFRLTKAVLGSMLVRGQGTVLNLSSDAAVSAYAGWGAYSAAKASLDQLTRVWAEELRGTGVRLLSVDPGEMDTRMHADAMPAADRGTLARPEHVARVLLGLLEASGEGAPRSGDRLLASEQES